MKITGQAFGVGAYEEEDEDIYNRDDMSRYDFSLGNDGEFFCWSKIDLNFVQISIWPKSSPEPSKIGHKITLKIMSHMQIVLPFKYS